MTLRLIKLPQIWLFWRFTPPLYHFLTPKQYLDVCITSWKFPELFFLNRNSRNPRNVTSLWVLLHVGSNFISECCAGNSTYQSPIGKPITILQPLLLIIMQYCTLVFTTKRLFSFVIMATLYIVHPLNIRSVDKGCICVDRSSILEKGSKSGVRDEQFYKNYVPKLLATIPA